MRCGVCRSRQNLGKQLDCCWKWTRADMNDCAWNIIFDWLVVTKKTITSTQANIFTLSFRSVPETFIGRSLFSSSGSCHDRDATWQEIGRTCGSACSCLRPGSRRTIVPLSEYVLPLWSIWYFCPIVQNCSGQPVDHTVIVKCVVSQC